MTVSETIEQGRTRVRSLQLDATAETQMLGTLDAIDRVVSAAREKASEALTILRDPALASKPAIAVVASTDLLKEAFRLLDGEQEPGS